MPYAWFMMNGPINTITITTQRWVQYPNQRPLKYSLRFLKNTPRSLTLDAEQGLSEQNWQNKDIRRLTVSIYRPKCYDTQKHAGMQSFFNTV